jgi:hypothetical protein
MIPLLPSHPLALYRAGRAAPIYALHRARRWLRLQYNRSKRALQDRRNRLRLQYRYCRRRLNATRRRQLFLAFFFLLRYERWLTVLCRRVLAWLTFVFATLAGLLMGAAFILSVPEKFLTDPALKVSDVHLAGAGIIGTALALVLTLSIIPRPSITFSDMSSLSVMRLRGAV